MLLIYRPANRYTEVAEIAIWLSVLNFPPSFSIAACTAALLLHVSHCSEGDMLLCTDRHNEKFPTIAQLSST